MGKVNSSNREAGYLAGEIKEKKYCGFYSGFDYLINQKNSLELLVRLVSGREVRIFLEGDIGIDYRDVKRMHKYLKKGDRIIFENESISDGSFQGRCCPGQIGKYFEKD